MKSEEIVNMAKEIIHTYLLALLYIFYVTIYASVGGGTGTGLDWTAYRFYLSPVQKHPRIIISYCFTS